MTLAERSGSRRAILRWGSRWDVFGGDAEKAAQAIVTELEGRGLTATRTVESGALRISATQSARWDQIVRGALLQRAEWWIERADDRLVIAADFRPFAGYSVFLAVLGLLFVALFEVGLRVVADPRMPTDADIALGGALLFGPLLFLVPWAIRLLAPLGGRPVEEVWNRVLDTIREGNPTKIDRPGVGLTLRHTAGLLAVLGVVGIELWRFWGNALGGPSFGGLSPVLIPVAGLVGVALLVVGASLAIRGLQMRMYGLIGGLTSSFAAAVALLALPLPWRLALEIGPERLAGQAGVFCSIAGAFSVVLLAVAAYLFLRLGLGLVEPARQLLLRLSEGSADGILHAATGSGARLWAFQAIFGAWWLLLAVLLGLAFGLGLAAAVDAVRPGSPGGVAPIATVSIDLVGRAIGRPDDPAVGRVLRTGWLVHSGVGLSALFLSLADLGLRRRQTRLRLRQAAVREFPERSAVEASLGELARRARLGPVRLALVEGGAAAEAHRFGVFRPERFVAIAASTVENLPPERLAAVLAHEVAHHALGHLGRDAFLRWLGRLTFVGDGFVRSLEDGFAQELSADARAIDLGVAAGDLASALTELRRTDGAGTGRGDDSGRPALPGPRGSAVFEIPWRDRARSRWWLFRDAYRAADHLSLHYYHPVLELRLAALANRSTAQEA